MTDIDMIWIKSKAREMKSIQTQLYSGTISGREYQDKIQVIKDTIRLKYGLEGVSILNKAYKDLIVKDRK